MKLLALLLVTTLAAAVEELPYISGYQPRNHVLTVRDNDKNADAIQSLFQVAKLPSGPTVNRLADVPTVPEHFRGDFYLGYVSGTKAEVQYSTSDSSFSVRATSVRIKQVSGNVLIELVRIQHVKADSEEMVLLVGADHIALFARTILLRKIGKNEFIAYQIDDTNPGKNPFDVWFYRALN